MKAKLLKRLRKQASEVYVEFHRNNRNDCHVRLPYPKSKEYLNHSEDAVLYKRKWKTSDGEFEYGFAPNNAEVDCKIGFDEAYTIFDRSFVYENKSLILNCALRFLLNTHIAYRSSRKTKLIKWNKQR